MKFGYDVLDVLEMENQFAKLLLSSGKNICCVPLWVHFTEDEDGWDTVKWLMVDVSPEKNSWPLGNCLNLSEEDIVSFQRISKEEAQRWCEENSIDDIIDTEHGSTLKEGWKSEQKADILDKLQEEDGYVRLFLPNRECVYGRPRHIVFDRNDSNATKKILFELYPFDHCCFFTEEDIVLYQRISKEELKQDVGEATVRGSGPDI